MATTDEEEIVILLLDHDLTAAGRSDLLHMIDRLQYQLRRVAIQKVKPLCLPCQNCLACLQSHTEMCLNPSPQ